MRRWTAAAALACAAGLLLTGCHTSKDGETSMMKKPLPEVVTSGHAEHLFFHRAY